MPRNYDYNDQIGQGPSEVPHGEEGVNPANDVMLFSLGLYHEAGKYGIKSFCKPEGGKKLQAILAGEPDKLDMFWRKLRAQEIENAGALGDYEVRDVEPYDGDQPDWEYHNLVMAQNAAYLRTQYMKDVKSLLIKLAEES